MALQLTEKIILIDTCSTAELYQKEKEVKTWKVKTSMREITAPKRIPNRKVLEAIDIKKWLSSKSSEES